MIHRPASRGLSYFACMLSVTTMMTLALTGCGGKQVVEAPVAPPTATFTGPAYLAGTIGSMTSRRGYGPLLVSGYGLVVNLPGTGSGQVPGYLRPTMVQRLRREGFGSRRAGLAEMTPDSILNSEDTAVVAVEGLIPAGAVEGTRFDVLVSALPQTDTTNLEGGFLRTTDLSLLGTNEQMRYSRTLSKARGSMYLSPFDEEGDVKSAFERNLQAVVIGGGVVTQPRRLDLILNQPSWTRSSQLAQRINEVFRKESPDRTDTAVAKTDLIIQINIPTRYASDPGRFMNLMEHVYTQRGATFEETQAKRLGEVLTLSPAEADRVSLAWEALGKRALDVIRGYYEHENLTVRLAALKAGVHLEDQLAADPLLDLSQHPQVAIRLAVAKTLAALPQSLRGSRVLIELLDDDVTEVRIEAYESLRTLRHPGIVQTTFMWDKAPKFTLDLVPATKPLVYISTRNGPRVVIFNPMTPFKASSLAKLWDNQLMIRRDGDRETMTVFYQHRDDVDGKTYTVAATAANLVYLLSHESTVEQPTDGLNLPFSRVVNVLYNLCKNELIPAKFEMQETPLARQIAQSRQQQSDPSRPLNEEELELQRSTPEPSETDPTIPTIPGEATGPERSSGQAPGGRPLAP